MYDEVIVYFILSLPRIAIYKHPFQENYKVDKHSMSIITVVVVIVTYHSTRGCQSPQNVLSALI